VPRPLLAREHREKAPGMRSKARDYIW
jgi:hypothetical protein